MRVADSSALYAAYDAGDAHHDAARAFVASGEAFLVPSEIASETLGLIQLRFGPTAARQAATYLRCLPQAEFHPTPDDFWDDVTGDAWTTFLHEGDGLSHADSIVVAWARRRGLQAWTYDKALARKAAT